MAIEQVANIVTAVWMASFAVGYLLGHFFGRHGERISAKTRAAKAK